jgi:peptide subunit release factor 1 (eRF1)
VKAADHVPSGAIHSEELNRLFDDDGPFLSVYMNTEPAIEKAAQRDQLAWKSLRHEAHADGADEQMLGQVDPLVPDAHMYGNALAVIATRARVRRVEHLDWPVREEVARCASLPSVAPLIEAAQARVRHLIVVVDRRGADLLLIDGTEIEETEAVREDRYPIRKVKAGGWSEPRYQQRAEKNWDTEAHDIATHVTQTVDEHDPRLVLAAGDIRMIELLQKALPKRVAERLRVIGTGARGKEGPDDERRHNAMRMAATAVAEDTVALLKKFREEHGQGDLAVDGAQATVDALAKAQVEVLLVHDDRDDKRRAWFGPQRAHIASEPDDLRALGLDEPHDGRLVDVAIRAALGTGAGVRVIPKHGPVNEGIGGLLRWR